MAEFVRQLPDQFVETGIAEQNLVGIAAGMAASGLKPYVTSPACFLSMRSIEQVKVDVAYSHQPVRLIGISGGLSYGALGMSHHSLQDLAVMRAIPGIQVVLPADRHETKKLIEAVQHTRDPIYIRIGRNPVPDVYPDDHYPFVIGNAVCLHDGTDVTVIATGETVRGALDAALELGAEGISCRVLNLHTIKPLDEPAILAAAADTGAIVTVEEHSVHGGLGAAVAELLIQNLPVPMRILGVPDEPAVPGTSAEVFRHYGLDADGIKRAVHTLLERKVTRR
jgi:transketolase